MLNFRSWQQIKAALKVELYLLKGEWVWVLVGAIYEYISLVSHNLAYYLHRQGPALRDLGFELLPEVTGTWAKVPDYLTYTMFAILVLAFISILVLDPKYFRTNEVFGRRPKRVYIVLMGRRILVSLAIAFILRAMSFLSTLLPGATPVCRPEYDKSCLTQTPGCNGIGRGSCMIPNPLLVNSPLFSFLLILWWFHPIPPVYDPPKSFGKLLVQFSVTAGCGDLVFSQHTTYQLTITMALWKYLGTTKAGPFIKVYTMLHLLAFTILDIAARHHYTNDLVTAFYVNGMIWFLLEAYWPDPDDFSSYNIPQRHLETALGEHASNPVFATRRLKSLPDAIQVQADGSVPVNITPDGSQNLNIGTPLLDSNNIIPTDAHHYGGSPKTA